jgi:predicted DNA-binding transcriptional regulator AlpA
MKKASYPFRPGTRLLRPKKYLDIFAVSRSEYHRRVGVGQAPYPVQVGTKSVALPNYVADDYVRHLIESDEPFDAERYIKQVGGRVINA